MLNLNLTNSKIFSCGIMNSIPKPMFDLTKDFIWSLDSTLRPNFNATVHDVIATKAFGEGAITIAGVIQKRESDVHAKFSMIYDVYKDPDDNLLHFKVVGNDSGEVILSENIKEKGSFEKIFTDIKAYLNKNNGPT